MNSKKIFFTILLLLTFIPTVSLGADLQVGKNKASKCLGCHGADGNSVNPIWPSLAGQKAAYLSAQLRAFRDGTRKDPVMSPMAAELSNDDTNNLAAYFSSLPPKSAGGDQELAAQGKSRFNMCMGCHGTFAKGRGIFPRLAGQQPVYIVKQLNDFKNKSRISGPMQAIALGLSDEDIAALAAYLGSLK